jgi:hypothetical protein
MFAASSRRLTPAPQAGSRFHRPMFEQAFKNIDDVLRKEAGCTTELDYTEQTSWLLFLKYLDGLEQDKQTEAELEGKKHAPLLEKHYRWETWAAPKGKDGQIDHNKALSGDDLRDFVNGKLFPYLHGFKQRADHAETIEYKIGEIFGEIKTRSRAATTSARSSTTSTNCGSARRRKSTSCRSSTKPKSSGWAMPGATAASTTPPAR